MSTLAPGAVDDRVCHSCNTVACAQENIYFDSLDDLSIQPHESEGAQYKAPRGNQRKIMERQIRSSKPNLPAVKPSGIHAAAAKPGERVTLSAEARWLVCEKICLPEDGKFAITLPVMAAPPPSSTTTCVTTSAGRPRCITRGAGRRNWGARAST